MFASRLALNVTARPDLSAITTKAPERAKRCGAWLSLITIVLFTLVAASPARADPVPEYEIDVSFDHTTEPAPDYTSDVVYVFAHGPPLACGPQATECSLVVTRNGATIASGSFQQVQGAPQAEARLSLVRTLQPGDIATLLKQGQAIVSVPYDGQPTVTNPGCGAYTYSGTADPGSRLTASRDDDGTLEEGSIAQAESTYSATFAKPSSGYYTQTTLSISKVQTTPGVITVLSYDSSGQCGEAPTPTQPSTCSAKGDLGSYPSCHPPTCPEQGEVGAYPSCTPSPCQAGEAGSYPNCYKPPVANCDAYWVRPGHILRTSASAGPLINDSDPRELPLQLKVVHISFGVTTHPYTLDSQGDLMFDPGRHPGKATIEYEAVDSDGAVSAPTSVSIYIQRAKPQAAVLSPCPAPAAFSNFFRFRPVHSFEWYWALGGLDLNHGPKTDLVLASTQGITAEHCSIYGSGTQKGNPRGGNFTVKPAFHLGGFHKGMVFVKSIDWTISDDDPYTADASFVVGQVYTATRNHVEHVWASERDMNALSGDWRFEGPSTKFPKPGKLTLTLNKWLPSASNHEPLELQAEFTFDMGTDLATPDLYSQDDVPDEIDSLEGPVADISQIAPATCDFTGHANLTDFTAHNTKPQTVLDGKVPTARIMPVYLPDGPPSS